MIEDLNKIMKSLAECFCERRAYRCLFRFLPAYFAQNELTDGWADCRKALADTRALCSDDLRDEEMNEINKAMNIIDKNLYYR